MASGGLASRGRLARGAVGGTASDALAGGGIGVSEWVLALAAATTKDGTEIESAFGGLLSSSDTEFLRVSAFGDG